MYHDNKHSPKVRHVACINPRFFTIIHALNGRTLSARKKDRRGKRRGARGGGADPGEGGSGEEREKKHNCWAILQQWRRRLAGSAQESTDPPARASPKGGEERKREGGGGGEGKPNLSLIPWARTRKSLHEISGGRLRKIELYKHTTTTGKHKN